MKPKRRRLYFVTVGMVLAAVDGDANAADPEGSGLRSGAQLSQFLGAKGSARFKKKGELVLTFRPAG